MSLIVLIVLGLALGALGEALGGGKSRWFGREED